VIKNIITHLKKRNASCNLNDYVGAKGEKEI
jgi:hypothetical protein